MAIHFQPNQPIVVHLIKPERPLPLDPDFYAGHVTAERVREVYGVEMVPGGSLGYRMAGGSP